MRTVERVLWDKIGELLTEFSPTECANFFAAAGYVPAQTESALAMAGIE